MLNIPQTQRRSSFISERRDDGFAVNLLHRYGGRCVLPLPPDCLVGCGDAPGGLGLSSQIQTRHRRQGRGGFSESTQLRVERRPAGWVTPGGRGLAHFCRLRQKEEARRLLVQRLGRLALDPDPEMYHWVHRPQSSRAQSAWCVRARRRLQGSTEGQRLVSALEDWSFLWGSRSCITALPTRRTQRRVGAEGELPIGGGSPAGPFRMEDHHLPPGGAYGLLRSDPSLHIRAYRSGCCYSV